VIPNLPSNLFPKLIPKLIPSLILNLISCFYPISFHWLFPESVLVVGILVVSRSDPILDSKRTLLPEPIDDPRPADKILPN
jgi:hypothetical protein